MPNPLVAIGGASLVGGVLGDKGNRRAANAQTDAAAMNTQLAREQFNKTEKRLDPYNQAGLQAIKGINDFTDPAKRAAMMDQYSKSAEFQNLAGQARNQQLAAGEATGGLGSTTMQSSLATIAPQLQQQYMQNMYNQRMGIANMGLGAATQTGAAGQNFVSAAMNNNTNAANAMAQYRQQQGQMFNNIVGGGLGMAMGGGYF